MPAKKSEYNWVIIINEKEYMDQTRKRIYLCLAHMSDEGIEQKYQ